jgi:hypothetical protein
MFKDSATAFHNRIFGNFPHLFHYGQYLGN